MPLQNTRTDFWVLIREYDVHTIVMMNAVSEAEVSIATNTDLLMSLTKLRDDFA